MTEQNPRNLLSKIYFPFSAQSHGERDGQPASHIGSRSFKTANCFGCHLIYWILNSWKEVENATIQKCFINTGFNMEHNEQDGECEEVIDDEGDDDDDNIPLATLRLSYDLFGCSFKSLTEIDKQCHTCDTETIDSDQSVSELSKLVGGCESDVNDDQEEEEERKSVFQSVYPHYHRPLNTYLRLKLTH